MDTKEILDQVLLEFDVHNATIFYLLIGKGIFTQEEYEEAKKTVRPTVIENTNKVKEILKKKVEAECSTEDKLMEFILGGKK